MGTRDEAPPDLREMVGVAVTACHGTESALSRVAALGAATLALPDGPLLEPAPASWHKDRRLSGVLWRIRGRDRPARREAAILLARRLRRHHLFKNFCAADEMLLNFSWVVVIEWEHDRCSACGGTMLVNPDPDATARNVHRTKRCEVCQRHPGRAKIDHAARASALKVSREVYDKHWAHRFDRAHALLVGIEPKIESPLRKQSSRRSIAPT
jgi:hypothetical protein